MGIDRSALNAILMSCRHIKNKQNLLTIGRQQIHTSQENNIDIGDKFNTNLETYIIIIARKISNKREFLIENCPNQYSYEQHDWKK